MYHLIDTSTMTVLATNYNMQLLVDLRRYEYPKLEHYLVCNADLTFRNDREVRALAKRYLGKQEGSRESLILELRKHTFPIADINGRELAQLVESLREADSKPRKYVKGMLIKVQPNPPQAHTQHEPVITNTHTRVSPPSRKRESSVKDTVYSVADAMWEAVGKPMDVHVVLELRKLMYSTLLNEYGIKRDTSSNTLAGWWKLKQR